MDGYTKLPNGCVVPYPVDTQLPKYSADDLNKDEVLSLEIIHKTENFIIFLPNKDRLKAGCATLLKFAIFTEQKNWFCLYRWDNTGGWVKIVSDNFESIDHAKHAFLPVTKYFV